MDPWVMASPCSGCSTCTRVKMEVGVGVSSSTFAFPFPLTTEGSYLLGLCDLEKRSSVARSVA